MGGRQPLEGYPGPERRVFGFVEAITKPDPDDTYARAEVVLDAVDAARFIPDVAAERSLNALSIIRIQTTPRRWREWLGDEPLEEGQWLEVELAPRFHMPIAWVLEADGDYSAPLLRTNVVGARRLGLRTPVLSDLQAWCEAPVQAARRWQVVRGAPEALHVRIVDVGHASFAALHTEPRGDAPIRGYFDVGGPVFFHNHTLPPGLIARETRRMPADGFVALSHWDFDHYALAVTRMKALQGLTWIAPDQAVGPNARRLQGDLGARLTLVEAPSVALRRGLTMYKGLGPASDRNNSGYALRVQRGGHASLLAGDLGYDHMPLAAKVDLSGLGVTHHGGNGGANPPQGTGRAVASYGLPNKYCHPVEVLLAGHAAVGWAVAATAERGGVPRGDRWLT